MFGQLLTNKNKKATVNRNSIFGAESGDLNTAQTGQTRLDLDC
jgi:hypothetical protein